MPKAKQTASKKTDQTKVIDQVIDIIQMMGENTLAELDLETSEMKMCLKKHGSVSQQQVVTVAPQPMMQPAQNVVAPVAKVQQSQKPVENTPAVEKHNYHEISSPMAGTFYRSPSPTSDPFAKEGDVVTEGQTICIVEAMKMMNEIKADRKGKVVKILIENGKPVEKGSILFHIEAEG